MTENSGPDKVQFQCQCQFKLTQQKNTPNSTRLVPRQYWRKSAASPESIQWLSVGDVGIFKPCSTLAGTVVWRFERVRWLPPVTRVTPRLQNVHTVSSLLT